MTEDNLALDRRTRVPGPGAPGTEAGDGAGQARIEVLNRDHQRVDGQV